jgi:hypothetical protein
MDDKPEQPPEGRLLAAALRRSGRSARSVAKEMGISDTRLRHIINGYQPVGRGQTVTVVGPAETVARAAAVLKVTPDDLAQAGRPDAGELLRAAQSNDWSSPGMVDLKVETAVRELREFLDSDWLSTDPPESALFMFSDEQVLDEMVRRFRLRTAQVQQWRRQQIAEAKPSRAALSVADDNIPDAVAAHDEEDVPTVGEQGESDLP